MEFKLKVIEEVDRTKKKKDVCAKYQIAQSTLSTFLKDREKLITGTDQFDPKRKKFRKSSFDEVDRAVYLWVKQARAMEIPISGPIIMAKADNLAKELIVDRRKITDMLS